MNSNAGVEFYGGGAVGRLLGQLVGGDLHEAEVVPRRAFSSDILVPAAWSYGSWAWVRRVAMNLAAERAREAAAADAGDPAGWPAAA